MLPDAKPRSRATIRLPAEVFTKDIYPPAQPVGLQAVFSSVGQKPFVDLTWAPNSETDVAGYNVFRRSAWRRMAEAEPEAGAGAVVPRRDSVQPGTRYEYSVSAVDLRGNESPRSAETSEEVPSKHSSEGLRAHEDSAVFEHAGNIGYGLIEDVAGASTITRTLRPLPCRL